MRRRDVLIGTAGLLAAPLAGALPAPRARAQPVPTLPRDFLWGASTSAYQIEGAVKQGGRKPSIWDTFSHTPGRIADGTTGDVACDHYHRYLEDIGLLTGAGFEAYRFSIAWPRILPDGTGAVNDAGLDFYDRLVDALLAAGVAPWACPYHWDLPQALQDRGGWTNRDSADWFADYVRVVVARLGDRVPNWVMLNEPNVHAIFGHAVGIHAPGLTGFPNYISAQHHMNLAQGRGLVAARAERSGLTLGTVFSLQPIRPASDSEADRAAAKRFDAIWNRINLDPLFHGRYPELFGAEFAPLVKEGDMAAIQQPVDLLGVNYYGPSYMKDDPGGVLGGTGYGALPPGMPVTALGWPIDPEGLVEVLGDLRSNYGNPVTYVTENGACYDDPAPVDGVVDDPKRAAFIASHLAAAARAIEAGANLKGYFAWSLLDNFEWAEGEAKRFGIVAVDFETQVRTPKTSYRYLKDVIAQHR